MTSPSIPDAEGDIHLERAYIDYFVPGTPLSLTFGRLPTNEGPPNEIKDNTTRKSTWPKLMIDGESDGIIANLSLYKWTGLKIQFSDLPTQKSFRTIRNIPVWIWMIPEQRWLLLRWRFLVLKTLWYGLAMLIIRVIFGISGEFRCVG